MSCTEWGQKQYGCGDGGKEFRERWLELGDISEWWCRNLVQWRLPRTYEGEPDEDLVTWIWSLNWPSLVVQSYKASKGGTGLYSIELLAMRWGQRVCVGGEVSQNFSNNTG